MVTNLPESISWIWVKSDRYPRNPRDIGQYRALLLWVIYWAMRRRMLIFGLKQAIIDVNVRGKPMKRENDIGQI